MIIKARLSEIFRSIQGEGKYAGIRQIFVRFYGCHMRCSWCDTPYAIGDKPGRFKEWTKTDILKEINKLKEGCHSISLTGGEPLLQSEFIQGILPTIRKTGLKIYLETSGVLHNDLKNIINYVDIVSMDFKLPSSTQCRSYWREHEAFLRIAKTKDVFIKTVITTSTTSEDVITSAKIIKKIAPQTMFILQPNYFERHDLVMAKCIKFQEVCLNTIKDVRIMPQMHKFMKVR